MRHDKYESFEILRRAEPADAFHIGCRPRPSAVVIIAPHGGKIERWTSEFTAAIAGDEYSSYCFEGLKRRDNSDLHITSHHFDEPQALALVSNCNWVIAVHGCAGEERVVYLGGLDHALRDTIGESLKIGGFAVGEHKDPNLQGAHPRNICNRGKRGRGVQLEISCGLRSALMSAPVPEGVPNLAAFVAAVRDAIESNR